MYKQEKLFSNDRVILLTLKEEYFDQILNGTKLHEFRFRFPVEDVIAYIYLPSPIKKVVGKFRLSNTRFLDIKTISDFYHKTYEKPYSEMFDWVTPRKGCYVSDITDVMAFEKCINYEELIGIKGFSAPQQYMYLESKLELLEVLEKLK
ncbi:MAG: hypothetical protein KQ78_01242 [Candidatus Izimaplasma bacterium HR2]|nr:MAG: hypothetical protein KQ78_01242 [Candidatus Izimaplasma bacterium HR2]